MCRVCRVCRVYRACRVCRVCVCGGEHLEEREQLLRLAHALARVTQAVDLLDERHDDGVHGAGCMVRAWCVVCGAWCVRGVWCVVHGAWCVVRGLLDEQSVHLALELRLVSRQ